MNDNRREILEMLAAGKITAGEAERLIAALEKGTTPGSVAAGSSSGPKAQPKYLRVQVESNKDDKNGPRVNVRVPMQLLRAGVKLASLIPAQARDRVNDSLRVHGMVINLDQIKPENLDEVMDQLNELTVDLDQKNTKVRFFCE